MTESITIDLRGLRRDCRYIGGLALWWAVWTPMTAAAAYLCWMEFHWFLLMWLVFASLGVLAVPWMLWQARKPQTLEARDDCLIIHGVAVPFRSKVRMPRDQPITLFFGRWTEDGETEGGVTLNLFYGKGLGVRRVMLAPMVHPSAKQEIFRQVSAFLCRNGFQFSAEGETGES